MSYSVGTGYYQVEAAYADLLRRVGLADGMSVFEHAGIQPWRSIAERENCVLDVEGTRLHVKRNKKGYRGVDDEVAGIRLLQKAGIATVPLMGYGRLHDGRGFVITEHLHDHEDCERLLERGTPFDSLLEPTARVAGKLHGAKLHHRDLYVGHFWARADAGATSSSDAVRLIDAARVKPLPRFFATRWAVKDVAQFLFSLRRFAIPDQQVRRWLGVYAQSGGHAITESFRRRVDRKADWIARHDARLRQANPTRNVAIDR
jgi:hypothetical protein